jgi:CheY-like chemotaxis protein/anti-sigma regulatory factor (Ser/Thr protein kinase)
MTTAAPTLAPTTRDSSGTAHDTAPATVLVVDDSPVDRRVAGRVIEKRKQWRVIYAANGLEALEVIGRDRPDAVVTDLQMPGMDGLSLVTAVREQYSTVPVILMTGQGSEKIAVAALRAGAASYVAKRVMASDLGPAIEQVLNASQTDDGQTRLLKTLRRRTSHYVLDNDPSVVSALVAVLQQEVTALGICDATAVTRVGIALEEALLNAIYHGNLGISSELKAVNEHAFHAEAAARRGLSPYRDRRVRVTAKLTPDRATFAIADEGDGFDITKLPDPTDPEYFDRPSGRGILLIRAFMDDVRYNATGNRVTLIKKRDE